MSAHQVPTKLGTPDGIGPFSLRQAGLIGGYIFAVLTLWDLLPKVGPALPVLDATIPLLPLVVFAAVGALVFIGCLPPNPPPEHGLFAALGWLRVRTHLHGMRSATEVDEDLGNPLVDGDTVVSDYGFVAVWEIPSLNLRLADAAEVDVAEDLWGQFLMGVSGHVQTITTANPIDGELLASTIRDYPRPQARQLATWLRDQSFGRGLIERRHFIAVSAEDLTLFDDASQQVTEGLHALGLRSELIRRLEGDELCAVIKRTWSPRPPRAGKGISPDGPWTVNARQVQSDGEWHETVALSRFPRVIYSNFLSPYIDGPYPVDVVQHITPIEPDEILDRLERRSHAMRATKPTLQRTIAIEDLERFTRSMADGTESPFEVATYFHVRGVDRVHVATEAKRVMQRLRRVGARGTNLRWEQAAALKAIAPLAMHDLQSRAHTVDTSTIKRAYPCSASAMWPEGAVPWGETLDSKRPVGWTAWRRPLISNPHLVVYAFSGAGKGFAVKVHESRALFAGITRQVFGFDQAEEDDDLGEYGLFAAYCGLEYRHIRCLADLGPALCDIEGGPGVIWNIAGLSLADRPEVMVRVKDALFALAAERPAPRKLIVDELWTWVKGAKEIGADEAMVARSWTAIEDFMRRGRHLHLGADWMTQRAKDSIESPLMQIIQSQAASQMFGLQQPAEISDVAERLHWTRAEVAAIKRFQAGNFLLSAGPWRVTFRVTASPDEYAMANTDGKVEQVNDAPRTMGRDHAALADEPAGVRRNGHRHEPVAALAVRAQ